jgi:iron complex outermembrane receptor protein
MQRVPDYTLTLGFIYKIPASIMSANHGGISIAADYYHNSGWFADPQNRARQVAYNVVNGSLNWTSPSSRWNAQLWAHNLTNEWFQNSPDQGTYGDALAYAPPRTYGVTVGMHF